MQKKGKKLTTSARSLVVKTGPGDKTGAYLNKSTPYLLCLSGGVQKVVQNNW